jgi:hypothetical protein
MFHPFVTNFLHDTNFAGKFNGLINAYIVGNKVERAGKVKNLPDSNDFSTPISTGSVDIGVRSGSARSGGLKTRGHGARS